MTTSIIGAALLVVIVGGVVVALPDLVRYLRIQRM